MIWLHSEGNFSFSLWGHKITTRGKIYKLAITTGNKCEYYQFVWKNHAPPKVKFFAWLLLQERIQCKTNLKRKNVLDSDTCDLCGLAPETPDHIISQCEFTRRFWLHLGWDPASIPPVSKLWEVQGQAGAPARSLSRQCSSSAAGTCGFTDMESCSDIKLWTSATFFWNVTMQLSFGVGAYLSNFVMKLNTGATSFSCNRVF